MTCKDAIAEYLDATLGSEVARELRTAELGREAGRIEMPACMMSGLVIAAFAPLMPRKTWDGARAMERVQGFREFLERAEKDRLKLLPADTLHRWLPWAIALGVTDPVDAPAWYAAGAGRSDGAVV